MSKSFIPEENVSFIIAHTESEHRAQTINDFVPLAAVLNILQRTVAEGFIPSRGTCQQAIKTECFRRRQRGSREF